MKFILSILALLAIAFLVGCSAKDTRDNKLSNSEITKLGKKYGGCMCLIRNSKRK